ncbi:MAG: PIN domain-containing protein [Leptospiraceae bacterium]|nr:PIN domain-containing protein [Leptospiraceae bacterium]MCP5513407.1 PIN domain-containing protein [Leptospiraceae bacterium]
MKIYLDNCSFNRPYDDQSQIKIFLESQAKLFIQSEIKKNKIELIWSYILDYENSRNSNLDKMKLISDWKSLASIDVEESQAIIKNSKELMERGLDIYDSLHIACAFEGNSDFFVTTDRKIINKLSFFQELKILNPIEFLNVY